jgi:hypothetical protein
MISDAATARHGSQSLIYGLLIPTMVSLLTAGFFLAAANKVSPEAT